MQWIYIIIIGSSIIFKYGGYQQCRITVVSPCAGYPYHFAKAYLDRSILKGFRDSTLSSPRHGVCAYPTPTSDDKKHSTRKFGFLGWLLKQVVSWGRCIRRNWIPWGPKTLQRVPGISSSPHSVSGKDIKSLAIFRPWKQICFSWGQFSIGLVFTQGCFERFEGPIVGPLNVGETLWNRIHK